MKTYMLVPWKPGLTVNKVEKLTGLKAIETPLGVLVEKPSPFDVGEAMAIVNRALRPREANQHPWFNLTGS